MKDFQGQRDASANEKNVQLFKGWNYALSRYFSLQKLIC